VGKSASSAQSARARARERMVEIERERLERQKRMEDAATAVYLAVERRAIASEKVNEAEQEIAAALRVILAEGVDVERVAALCDMSPTYVRQVTRRHANGLVNSPMDA
jgi:hypothetical protein